MSISINWRTGVITVPKSFTSLVQLTPVEIRNLDIDIFRLALKDLEDDDVGIVWPRTHDHNTEVSIGGVTLARVVEILDPYTVTFEDGSYAVNLIGANSNIGDKVNLNSVSVRSSNSAGLVNITEIEKSSIDSKYIVEGLRPHHSGFGTTWYWDPNNGDDARDGLLPENAIKTFSVLHDLVGDGANDIIFCIAPGQVGATVVDYPISITKNGVFLRGPGRRVMIRPSDPNVNAITISGSTVEVSGFRVETLGTGTGSCIHVATGSDFTLLEDLWINGAGSYGILVDDGDYIIFNNLNIHECGVAAVLLEQVYPLMINHLEIKNCIIDENTNGVHLIADLGNPHLTNISIANSQIHDNVGFGLKIESGAAGIRIHNDTFIENNGTDIDDATNSLIDQNRIWKNSEKKQIRSALGIDGDKVTATNGQLQSLIAAIVAADLTAAAGSTNLQIRTSATQASNFYDGLICVIINAAGSVARTVTSFNNTNGAFNLDIALPFTPIVGDRFVVLGRVASAAASVDNSAVALAVWAQSKLSPAVGSYGELVNNMKLETGIIPATL